MATRELARPTFFPTVFDEFFKPWTDMFESSWPKKILTIPAVNIKENKDNYMLSLAAPGLTKEDFKIDLDGNTITISAEKEEEKEEKEEKLTRREYNFSSFSRTFTLPEDVKPEGIVAKYENGQLNLMLPRKEEAKKLAESKHIAVN